MVILENTPITKLNVPGNNFYIKRDDLAAETKCALPMSSLRT